MLRLKDAIDEKTLVIIQRMLMQFLRSSTALYEVDGTYVYSIFEGQYCQYLNDASYKNAGYCHQEALSSEKWICHKDCLRVSKESMEKREPVEMECSGGINIYAVPIMHNDWAIGSINAGITNPPLDKSKLESIAKLFNIDAGDLEQHACEYKRLTHKEMEIARMQLRMASLLISSLYDTKVKQIEAETEVKRQKEQLEAILDNMSESLFIFDSNGKYLLINKAGREYFGRSLEKVGESYGFVEYYDLEGNRVPFEDAPGYHVLHGRAVTEKVLLMKSPLQEKYVSMSGSPIFDEKGSFMYGVVTSRDVTEKIKQEQMIKQHKDILLKSEKAKKEALEKAMKMKDEFLATITHEFKTPLTVINAAIQVINTLYGDQISESVKKHIRRIRMNSFRQLRLVNNLLDITKYNAGHIKVQKRNVDIVYLTGAIIDSVMLFAKQKEVNLHFSSEIDYKVMAIDDEKYEKILLNLLSNAIKFTPKGKSIYVNLLFKSRKAIIKVKDEGVGIPKDKQDIIFERFGQVDSSLTRQAEGTGIGLSLVNALLSVLGGTIELESEVGKGSTFTVTLPITKLKKNVLPQDKLQQTNSRIMQTVEVEFSDIYSS